MQRLLIIFIVVPLLEMVILFEVADQFGGLSTLLLVILTAVAGLSILKRQGLSTLSRAHRRLSSGQLPAQEIVEAMLLAGAGALLLTPGFLTDFCGFVFLTGFFRQLIAAWIIQKGFLRTMEIGQSNDQGYWTKTQHKPDFGSDNVYEGEYTNEDSVETIEDLDKKN